MDAAAIQAIGEHIILPLVILGIFYLILKD